MKRNASTEPNRGAHLTRRAVLGRAALAAATVSFVPGHVLGGQGKPPAGEKLNIAGIGVGGMGGSNLAACRTENVVALCDVDFGHAAKTFAQYPRAKQYKDFRVMLDRQKDIDAVIVATPDHTHAVAALAAIQRGKHVYVQKPMAHSVYEARVLTEAARKHKVASQMGNQGRSGDGARLVCEWIWDGAIGAVREVHAWTNRPVCPRASKSSGPRRSRRFPRRWTGTCGSGPPRFAPIIPRIIRGRGGPGGTSAPARWAIWGATCSIRCFGR